MTFIRSISGFRGTIGGPEGDNLTPPDIVRSTQGYALWILREFKPSKDRPRPAVVIGRDARPSGDMVQRLVTGTLMGLGIDVLDLGLSTTPTVEIGRGREGAKAGSSSPLRTTLVQWNALKLLDAQGHFISAEAAKSFASRKPARNTRPSEPWARSKSAAAGSTPTSRPSSISTGRPRRRWPQRAKVAVDAVHSTGGIAVPALLRALGVKEVIELYCEPHGRFPHNPEPRPEHLTALSGAVVEHGCHLGITVDPDVDRLAFVCEDGSMFGEEYTLVAVADHVLAHTPGPVVSNLSSTRALRDVAQRHGQTHTASAVGEVNVVAAMRDTGPSWAEKAMAGSFTPPFTPDGTPPYRPVSDHSHRRAPGVRPARHLSGLPDGQGQNRPRPHWDLDALLAAFAKRHAALNF